MNVTTTPEVAEVFEAVRKGVARRLGRKCRLFSADDLIEDLGMDQEQFDGLVSELEEQFGVNLDADSEAEDQFTVVGPLVVRLLRLATTRAGVDDVREVA